VKELIRSTVTGPLDPFKSTAVLCDVEHPGAPESMEMVWAEVSVRATEQHRAVVEDIIRTFGDPQGGEIYTDGGGPSERAARWRPHLSLAYDNIEGSNLDLKAAMEVCQKYPTLVEEEREVKGISLWNMNGRLDEWRMVDSFEI
jgi:hypothetical protein